VPPHHGGMHILFLLVVVLLATHSRACTHALTRSTHSITGSITLRQDAPVILRKGEVFGELSFLGSYPFTQASIVAHSAKVVVSCIPFGRLLRAFSLYPRMATRFFSTMAGMMSQRVRQLSERTVAKLQPRKGASGESTPASAPFVFEDLDHLVRAQSDLTVDEERDTEFRRFFSMPDTELLLSSRACTQRRHDELLSGRLYISQHHCCFTYKVVFSWQKEVGTALCFGSGERGRRLHLRDLWGEHARTPCTQAHACLRVLSCDCV
jgi:GRAM domain